VMILQGKINLPGVHIPVQRAIYNPVLDQLAGTGLNFTEKTTDLR